MKTAIFIIIAAILAIGSGIWVAIELILAIMKNKPKE
jgi:hypothetical protein